MGLANGVAPYVAKIKTSVTGIIPRVVEHRIR